MQPRWPQLISLCLLSTCGCALFGGGAKGLTEFSQPLTSDQLNDFENDLPTRNVVRLAASIISAPATDKRVRELVWEELDESGLMSPEDRRRLNQSGIRVGVSGGTVPWALTSLKQGEQHQLKFRPGSYPSSGQNMSLGTHVAIPEGGRSVVELPATHNQVIIPAGRIAGLHDGAELSNARRILELTPVEYGNGWVVIRFLPQIHYGSVTTRFNIAGAQQTMPVRQRIQPLYEQQFELKLHANETAVIGYLKQDDWSVGRLLFQSDQLTSSTEGLIALQLQTIEKVAGQKSLHVDYSKY